MASKQHEDNLDVLAQIQRSHRKWQAGQPATIPVPWDAGAVNPSCP